MRFFFDRNMSSRLARMIDVYETEHQVRHHDDDNRFNPTTRDTQWIKVLGADDPPWVVISGDGHIFRNKVEVAALNEAKLTFFCMSKVWTHMKIYEYAWKFLKLWPQIIESAQVASPRIFEVSGSKVEIYQ
jgi:hypothetical protein